MFTIASSCSLFQRDLLTYGLSCVASNKKESCVVLDFSIPDPDSFWSVYGTGIKYIEDILPVLSGVNPKILKEYLSPIGLRSVLGFRDTKLKDSDIERILYLITALKESFKYIFVVLPDEISANLLRIVQESKCVLFPYTTDAISVKNVTFILREYSCEVYETNFAALRLDAGYGLNFYNILRESKILRYGIEAEFNYRVQEQILSPQFSYKDKSNRYVLALNKTLNIFDNLQRVRVNGVSSSKYYQNENAYGELRDDIHKSLVEEMKEYVAENDGNKLKQLAKSKISEILSKRNLVLPIDISDKLYKELCNDVAGLGVLEDFIEDSSVSEIMVNGYKNIYIERNGKIIMTGISFPNEERLKTVIDRIVSKVGRHIDESSPIVDARLKDGSRVNAVIKPVSLDGSAVTIRKFLKNKLSIESLVSAGSLNEAMLEFLKTVVLLKRNIIISGGTGTGKTTLLNAVSSFIPKEERIVTIEDSAELQLQQEHVVRLESRPKSTEGTGEINIRRLVVNALRMRPDRIIVGECRSGEALDMIQAMSTGHEGSLTTLHANSPYDAISRLTTMALMSGMALPEKSIVSQIASAINIIVQLARYTDGSRKISSISVINKTNDERLYEIKPVFQFDLKSFNDGIQKGEFNFTGYIPDFIRNAFQKGINVNTGIFK
ncbi:MAG: CpaF family protein [Endomicrobium sp.]|jgi:pilus assembly protein CpaF|nr:CpaF family protein [Endomicrobium sp.]